MKIYGYARVSKKEQAIEMNALDQQIARIKNAGVDDANILIDIESGRKDTRKNYKKLTKLIESGEVAEVVCTRVDRLGRSAISLSQFFSLCETKHVKVRCFDTPIDLTSPFGWHSAHQMLGLAEFESRLLAQRVHYGMEYFQKQGKVYNKPPLGYRKNSELKLEPNTDLCELAGMTYWEVAKECIRQLLEGHGAGSVAIYLNSVGIKLSHVGVSKWVDNPTLLGNTYYYRDQTKTYYANKAFKEPTIIYNTHPPLITEKEIKIIHQNRIKNRVNWNRHKVVSVFPLKGKFQCGVCGFAASRKMGGKNDTIPYIKCNQRNKAKHLCSNLTMVPYSDIFDQTIAAIITKSTQIIQKISSELHNDEIKESAELKALRQDLAGLESMRPNPAIATAIQDIKNQIVSLELTECQQLRQRETNEELQRKIAVVSQATFWKSLSESELIDTLDLFVDKVVITHGSVEILLTI
jgi:site-specific DNA recombinase